jgi:hypothetical protein
MQKTNGWTTLGAREARLKPYWSLAVRLLFAPPVYFLRQYLFRGLWRAGLYGFAFAGITTFGRWLRDAKMLERHLLERNGKP